MARLQIEKNDDQDTTLPGGRNVVHRWTLMLTPDDMADLTAGNPVKLNVALPNLTMRHLFCEVAVSEE